MEYTLNELKEYMETNNYEEENIVNGLQGIDNSIFKSERSKTISFDKIVPKGKMIAVRKHTRYIHYPAHNHDYVEICYILSGSSHQIIEQTEVTLSTGDILFMGPGSTHEILASAKNDILLNFIIHKKFFSYILEFIDDETSLSDFLVDVIFKPSSSKALIFKTQNKKEIEELLQKIIGELRHKSKLTESRIKFQLGLLIIELIQQKPRIIEKETYEQGLLIKVIHNIEKDLKRANLNEISEKLNVKNYNLSKMIKKESGKTFNELVRDIRLEKFCELIKIQNISINELAIEVGFSNTSDFYKKFKAKYGVSPREYRNIK
ncbi:AraC family transcriptional regulator [Vibrio maritimus]|uniref:AraC family transcriptional regulator n=1 Tax=Vibrio maritimus TaxID=990268 RepID=UPI003735DF4F